MTGLNHCTLMGTLSGPLEVRQTRNGKTWAVAVLEVQYYRRSAEGEPGQEESTLIPVNLFAKQAEIAQKYLQPGDPVVAQVRVCGSEFQPQNGGPVKRGVSLTVDALHLLPSVRQRGGQRV
jgi:single-stranded DNA-binding protein